MGGGDLNLKKSWHPSTMKNMERVWKAEQQDHEEKRKIAELKRELEMEKDREDMTKYAMDQGVIEKKDEKKLDWMYKGPNQMVSQEEYLLGRPIDKAFEEMARAEKDAEQNRLSKSHIEYECVPPSLRFFSGDEQVDLARKLQEDPLSTIKKKEIESRSQLLKNPVKLKQLKQLLEKQARESKNEKKNKRRSKKSKNHSDENENNSDNNLDSLLAAKYKKLKDRINQDDLIKSVKKYKKGKRKKHKRKSSSDSDSDTSDEEIEVKDKRNGKNKQDNISREENKTRKKEDTKKYINREHIKKHKHEKQSRESSDSNSDGEDLKFKDKYKKSMVNYDYREDAEKFKRMKEKNYDRRSRRKINNTYREEKYNVNDKSDLPNSRSNDRGRQHSAKKNYSLEKLHNTKVSIPSKAQLIESMKTEKRKKENQHWTPPKRPKLSEEEKEQKRQEMMENASWRDKQRQYNVKRYRDEEKKEQTNKTFNKDFIRKQLVAAAERGTVESRIKANINNIQRSARAMDTNFAKR